MWDLNELLSKANKNKISFDNKNYLRSVNVFNSTQVLLACILYDYKYADTGYDRNLNKNVIRKQVLTIFNGNEPTFENCHIWANSLLCQAIALLKNKEDLWNIFSADEKEKLTLIMKMFAYMWNFGCNIKNKFCTGISLKGNYAARWRSPNYWLCNQALLLFLVPFFGGIQNINNFITKTSYNELLSELKTHNFMNAYEAWSTPGFLRNNGQLSPGARELFGVPNQDWRDETAVRKSAYIRKVECGFENEFFAGTGISATIPILYKENQNVNDNKYPIELFHEIISIVFDSSDPCKSIVEIPSEEDFSAHISDGTTSPYEGMLGMMTEFNKADSMGARSSIFHCEIDFILTASMMSTMKYLIGFNYNNCEKKSFIDTGMGDFIYKREHGYVGYSMGNIEIDNRRIDSSLWIDWWKDNKEG